MSKLPWHKPPPVHSFTSKVVFPYAFMRNNARLFDKLETSQVGKVLHPAVFRKNSCPLLTFIVKFAFVHLAYVQKACLQYRFLLTISHATIRAHVSRRLIRLPSQNLVKAYHKDNLLKESILQCTSASLIPYLLDVSVKSPIILHHAILDLITSESSPYKNI